MRHVKKCENEFCFILDRILKLSGYYLRKSQNLYSKINKNSDRLI
jgi:hypothetical protein